MMNKNRPVALIVLIVLGGLVLLAHTSSALTPKIRPGPIVLPPPVVGPEPIVSAS